MGGVKNPSAFLVAAAVGVAMLLFAPVPATAVGGSPVVSTRVAGTPKAVNSRKIVVHLKSGIRELRTAAGNPNGYVRDKFKTWDDANHDCQDARSEVLRQESLRHVTGRCTVRHGLWVSYYDHVRFTAASGLDIDHLVPLAEAWRSGARWWSRAKREAYANDLTDKRTLTAVSAHSNRSKGDRDPAQWLPEYGQCRYVTSWVAVKLRWGLSADAAEKAALSGFVTSCGNPRIRVHAARVRVVRAPVHHSGGGSSTGSGGTSHACTRTSSGSCIRGGQFCPQASYGQVGYDAQGDRYVCSGDPSHPHWE